MLRQRAKAIEFVLYSMDLAVTVGAFLLTYWVRNRFPAPYFQELFHISHYLKLLVFLIPTWAILLKYFKTYRSYRTTGILKEAWILAKVVVLGGLVLGFVIFLLKYDVILSRVFILCFLMVDFVFLVIMRVIIRMVSRWVRKRGYNFRNMVLVGDDKRALEFAKMIEQTRWWGIRILGFMTPGENDVIPEIRARYPILGSINDLERFVMEEVVDEVLFLVTRKKLAELENVFLFLEDVGVKARVALNFFPNVIARAELSELNDIPLISFSTIPKDGLPLFLKAVMDRCLSFLLLLLLSPFMASVAFLIRLTSEGPAIIRQTRCGLNGRKFIIYKFRTMIANAEQLRDSLMPLNEMDGPVFKIKNDPRITGIGKWLRRTSVDELPQLLNVLKGDMSLVGPRPPMPQEVALYERWQMRRLSMKPGLTCLWQVSGLRNKVDFKKWMHMDLEYIDNWRLELDFKILLKTIPVMLSGKGM
ncbi:MAG: sugar transferase [Deltaproteobacteria bacterium]|nr:sugar transferase [Deltaproteobacteria bacterium]